MSETIEAAKWRRRERALAGGVFLWTISVAFTVWLSPVDVATWIVNTPPLLVAGALLILIGFHAAAVHFALLKASIWIDSDDPDGLTEVPWDE